MAAYGADDEVNQGQAAGFQFVQNWIPWPDNEVEQWTYVDNVRVQKFANRRDKSNILFLYQI